MQRNNEELFRLIVLPELSNTFYMVATTAVLASLIGFLLAIVLCISNEKGLKPNKSLYKFLDVVINTIRSFPFIILMVAIIPLTRFLVGTSIGPKAAIVPLTLFIAPFMSRLFENSLNEVDPYLIEAAKSFGASNSQIIFRVMLKEAFPSLVSNVTLAVISILGSSAMAGVVGAGGLGAVALTYGYQTYNNVLVYGTVVILIIIVQIIQTIGNLLYNKVK